MSTPDVPAKKPAVFISYAWKDGALLAELLYADLAATCEPWKDDRRMRGGTTWTRDVERAIDAADVLVALVSPGSNESKICGWERMRAFRKNKYIVGALAVPGTDLPLELEGQLYRDFSKAGSYESELKALREDIAQRRNGATLPERLRTTYVTAPPLPLNYIARTDVLASLREALIVDAARPSIAMTALQGMVGIGKTILALGLAHDDAVAQAFPDGVIWVSVGKAPAYDLTSRLREVGKALGDDPAAYSGEQAAKHAYRTAIRDKAVLIVLDDVWSVRDVEPFRAKTPQSRLLFTIRDVSLAASFGAELVTPPFLSLMRARGMLANYAGLE